MCATLVYIYVGGMPMCVAHSIAPPVAHFNIVSLCLLFVIPNITGSLRLCIKPGPPACQSDALTTTLPAPRVEVWNIGTIEVGSHSTQVPSSITTYVQFCAPISVWLRHILYWSQNIEWSCTCFTTNINQMCIMWFILCELYYIRAPGWRLPLHAGSLTYCIQW